MPRTSAAKLALVAQAGISVLPRLSAPSGLSSGQSELWLAIVNAKPSEWFSDENAPLLLEYVRAAEMCDRLAAKIEETLSAKGAEIGDVKSLLDMRDKESKRVASLGTKLRLTQQSRYTPKAAGTASGRAGRSRPWQEHG